MTAAAVHPSSLDDAEDLGEGRSAAEKEEDPHLVEKSLGLLSRYDLVRRKCRSLVSDRRFDTFILAAILLNSITLACVDYRFVDDNYEPSSELSLRNSALEKLELVFTVVFAMECALKIAAYGFIKGTRSYLRDGWNVLDFVIVVLGLLGLIPGVPNLSVLRSFRVLRPLRSVSKLPSLRKIATAFIESVSELANVGVLLLFILASFTLFGVTFWAGLFNSRCRLTPFPLRVPANCRNATDACWWNEFLLDAVTNPDQYRCLPFENDADSWTQSSSPWLLSGPQDCVWPVDETDLRVCSAGSHTCSRPVAFMGKQISRTCGSNYDAFGNPRFIDRHEPYGYPRLQHGIFNEARNWGFTNFDNFISSFVTTFQVLTLEGWTDIMSRVIDGWSPFGIAVFALLIIMGSMIALNIVLAVISSSLERISSFDHRMATEDEARASRGATPAPPEDTALRRKLRDVVSSRMYSRFILFTIVFNTLVLSCDHYGISTGFQLALDTGNFITTTIFFLDMVLCNAVYGARAYWSNSASCFDGIIAVSSVVELVLARLTAESGGNGKSVTSVFRSLRLVRLFKMVKQWKTLHSLLNTMAKAAADVRSFALLLCLFIFIYAMVGMQLFANRLHFDESTGAHVHKTDPRYTSANVPRSNFDDFFWSMTTVFQVLTGENWNSIMYDCWKATPVAPAYFISLIVFGVFCALNLFLAILLLPFDGSESLSSIRVYPLEGEAVSEAKNPSPIQLKARFALRLLEEKLFQPYRKSSRPSQRYDSVRRKCHSFVTDKRFDFCITVVIILSSIALALDDPLRDPTSSAANALRVLNYMFTSIFLLEFAVKVVGLGPKKYFQDRWNLLDFTAVVASILELSSVDGGSTLRVIRAFRVVRPLKMITKFPEIKVVVDALLLSLPSVADVGVVCALFFLVFSIFGVTFLKGTFHHCEGSSLTAEELHLITYPKLVGEMTATELSLLDATCSNTWDVSKLPTSRELCDCLNGGEWVDTIPQNFNSVIRGFALLFEISTTESWTDVMYAAVDQRGIDMQPVRDNNRWWALFFIVFLVLGAFFILELFVGVIIENFSRLRETKGRGLMTEAQQRWASTQQFVMKIKPEVLLRRPESKFRAVCYDFVMPGSNPWFDRFIVATIIANCISISTVSFGDTSTKTLSLSVLNLVFSAVFVMEAALKMIALGRGYFHSRWNTFDLTIVCGLIIGFILKASISDQALAASISSLISLMRMGRLIKLVRLVRQLRATVNTTLSVLPGMMNIGALLLLLFFVYGVCGMHLFGTIAFQGELNEQANFRTVGSAMLLLLRFSTGENWTGFMHELVERRANCDSEPVYDESSPWCLREDDYPHCREVNGCAAGASAYIYFYSFTILVSFIILNMFVAVVLEAFEANDEGDILEQADLEHFTKVWAEFDPQATWYLSYIDLQRFLHRLQPPLGFGEHSDFFIKDPCLLEIAVSDKKQVHIVNVAAMLAKRLAKQKQGDDFSDLSDDHPISNRLAKKSSVEGATTTLGDVYLHNTAVILRALARLRRKRRLAKEGNEAEETLLQQSWRSV